MRKGSKEAKAWGAKMRRLRGTKKGQVRKTARRAYEGLKKKRKKTRTKRRTTRKGMVRRTARRAYEKIRRRKKTSDSAWSW